MPKTRLSDQTKAFIVQQLAAWDPPSLVAKLVNERFDVKLTRQAIERYNPERKAGAALSPKLVELFHSTRRALVTDEAQVGIAHRAVRLRRLERMQLAAEARGDFRLATDIGEVAAKERGDAYTNTRVVKGALEVSAPKSLADFYSGWRGAGALLSGPEGHNSEGLN